MRTAVAFFVAVGVVMGCDHSPSAANDSHAVPFLALGDSYTIGEHVPDTERWPVQLAARLRARGVDVGDPRIVARTGWTTDELSAAMDETELHGPYRLVTLLIGVNDQFRGGAPEVYRPKFAAMLERAIALAGGKPQAVLVLSIPDWGVMPFAEGRDRSAIGQQIDAFNDVGRDECAKHGVGFVDVTPVSREATTQPSLGAVDGLHPSGTQYARWAALADAALRAPAQ
ncbi:MAG: GDSL-like Lipase/Acylhydrolase [Phycisphaerales bacterium]|nr:GDSL-like Lipase/Acylhydrolase [Phycisphaerales bacterium]